MKRSSNNTHTAWNKGRPWPDDVKKKIRESAIKAGVGKWNRGIPHTEEHIEKVSRGLKRYYQTHHAWNFGLPWPEEVKERIRGGCLNGEIGIGPKVQEVVDQEQ